LKSKKSSETELEKENSIDLNVDQNPFTPTGRNFKKQARSKEQNYEQSVHVSFSRRMRNPDLSSCWLNACLQLILAGFDHSTQDLQFASELGKEMIKMHNLNSNFCIDPTIVKDLLVYTEDTRIALRKSELINEIQHSKLQES
jgi:hypothetical protein